MSNFKDTISFDGWMTVKKYDTYLDYLADKSTQENKVHNKMTNAGLAVISGLVGNTGAQTAFTYLALGTSTTAVSASHTALQAESASSGLTRVSATVARVTGSQTNDTLRLTNSFTCGVAGPVVIEEVGIFNAASTGVMLARALSGSFSLVSGNVLAVTYDWKVIGN